MFVTLTRDPIVAGPLMKIEVLDPAIIGAQRHSSLRTIG